MKKYLVFLLALLLSVCSLLSACSSSLVPVGGEFTTEFASLEPAATGKVYYVSGTGNDSNTGQSTVQAFRTLQQAADLTQPGDTVYVMNGLYTSGDGTHILTVNTSGTASNYIYYRAYPGHKPKLKLNKNWSGIFVNGASYIVLDGFTIEGNSKSINLAYALANPDDISLAGTCIRITGEGNDPAYNGAKAHHIIARNNTVFDCPSGGITSVRGDYLRFEDNVVFGNSLYSHYATSGISVYQNWNSDDKTNVKIIIRRNIIFKNENKVPFIASDPDVSKRTITDGNGIIVDDARNESGDGVAYRGKTLIDNNLIYDNGGRGISIFQSDHVIARYNTLYQNARTVSRDITSELLLGSVSDINLYSNIIVPRSDRPSVRIYEATQGIRSGNNLYFGGQGNLLKTATDLLANPQFVNPSTNPAVANFWLQSSSPAIDAASGSYPLVDLLKAKRPKGNKADLGAYEVR
jgi:hypothetical protein